MQRFRIFISSPGDVASERAVAVNVIERVQLTFRGAVELEHFVWERSPLRATDTFQAEIPDIREADLALFILWSRMGTPLPQKEFNRSDGSTYSSGTEYEFERAREGYEKHKKPDILCYLKTAELRVSMKRRDELERQAGDAYAVHEFVDKWFKNQDGTFRSAFHSFEKTPQFEDLLESHLGEWVRRRLDAQAQTITDLPLLKDSPFRGLKTFDFEHALIYCGRTALVSEVIDVLRRRADAGRPFLMISGMSGVGKSSLVRAGVLPLLIKPRVVEQVIEWRRALFVPNDSLQGLSAGFTAALLQREALPELADTDLSGDVLKNRAALAKAVVEALDRATATARDRSPAADPTSVARMILVVDQFEEIFDEGVTREERTEFAEALTEITATGRVWVIATLRADFFNRCAELPEQFRDLFIERHGLYTVGGPRPAEITQLIRRPAMMAGLTFERRGDPEEGLDEVLRDEASGNPAVLPLLEFTLDELWQRRGKTGVLRFEDYRDLGGLYGALKLRASEVFSKLPSTVQAALPQVLAALVHTDPTDNGLIIQNRVSMTRFATPEPLALIKAFQAARLMVADRGPDGTPVVGFAHEALLKRWPPARKWIRQNRAALRLRANVAANAAQWRTSEYRRNRLLRGAQLRDAEKILVTNPEMLTPEDRNYVNCSKQLRRQNRIMATAAAAVVAIALAGTAAGLDRISYASNYVGAVPHVAGSEEAIPLSSRSKENLKASIANLTAHLRDRVPKMGTSPELVPWTSAQIWVALRDLEPSLSTNGTKLREFMNKHRDDNKHDDDPPCLCWRETEYQLPHSMVTAWVLYALASYKQPVGISELQALADRQRPGGWWSMFPANPDEKNASTSATAWTTFALHRHLEEGLIPKELEDRVAKTVGSGVEWLKRRARPGEARWDEYPPEQTAERSRDHLAVSALVIHVLYKTDKVRLFDGLWLDTLPRTVPKVRDFDMAKGFVFHGKHQFTLDVVRHYRFPWMLRTTVEAYRGGNLWQKARALLWIEEALKRPLALEEFNNGQMHEDWTMAEALYAMRDVADALNIKVKPAGQPVVAGPVETVN